MSLHRGDCFRNVASYSVEQPLALGRTRNGVEIKLLVVVGPGPHLPGIAAFLNFLTSHRSIPAASIILLKKRCVIP